MTSEEARILLSFHSGRNSDIKNPRWINGFLGSLRKFNGDMSGNNRNAGIEPRNSLELFGNSVESKKTGQRFTYGVETDTLHRFF